MSQNGDRSFVYVEFSALFYVLARKVAIFKANNNKQCSEKYVRNNKEPARQ